ncbi:PIN domain-containing protein [Adlercreutzia sp. ZJ138]|uniref:PIN domain-containing protein n=1 Tax=Adlercreutzia sp. ZJ138 TaxID=2709405 RepID=UPI0013EC6CF3|nr:PIN domain-containing protein [Adlercreutzia sp. ZJ138]
MSRKLLVDTNILLDAAMGERPGWAAATMLIDEITYEDVHGYVCAGSLKDVYYVLTKYADEKAAREFIVALMDLFEVVAIDYALCHIAATSDEPDFEDGLIRACAESVPVDFIISRDEKAFKRSPIKRLSAQDYLDLFCEVDEVSPAPQTPEEKE